MTGEHATYWMVPRGLINRSSLDFTEQRALIVYAILFNGPVIASDSDFIINAQLRHAVLHDSFVQSLIDVGYLRFAFRRSGDTMHSLAETAETIRRNRGHNRLIPDELYGPCPEFAYVERTGRILTYALDNAAERYTRETIRLLASLTETNRFSHIFPVAHAQALETIVHAHLADGQGLRWSFFETDSVLWDRLRRSFSNLTVEPATRQFLLDVTRGPYATLLPESLGVSPTYSHEDSLGVDMWRGRHLATEDELARRTVRRARISLVDYVAGLASLTLEDIRALREEHREREAYDAACLRFSRDLTDIDEPLRALYAYRRRIDAKILERLKKAAEDDTEELRVSLIRQVDRFRHTQAGEWVKFGILYALDSFTFGAFSLLEFAFQRFQRRPAPVSDADRSEVDKEVEMERLTREPAAHVLDGKAIVDKPDVRDFCTSTSLAAGLGPPP
jgi:hypothetical protein